MSILCTAGLILCLTVQGWALITVYDLNTNGGLTGFNAAASNPPISVNFDGIAPGTNINGMTFAGVQFQPSATGAPLIVVRGNDTFTPGGFGGVIDSSTNKLFPTSGQNVLSPGGLTLGPGPNNDAIQNDDLVLIFQTPVTAFGLDVLSQSADGQSSIVISVFNQSDALLFSGAIPISNIGGIGGGAPGGADFWGCVVTGPDQIGKIVIDETDGDMNNPDCNIGFDSFRFFGLAVVKNFAMY